MAQVEAQRPSWSITISSPLKGGAVVALDRDWYPVMFMPRPLRRSGDERLKRIRLVKSSRWGMECGP